jgi:site-specific recombinase XerD
MNNIVAEFLSELKRQGRSNATILAYGKDANQLIEFMQQKNSKMPRDLNTDLIEQFKKTLLDQNYTGKSISRKLNSIKSFCRYLITKNLITDNPAAKIEHPKYSNQPPRILTKMEYRSLRDACRNDLRLFAIVELLLQTGIRIGELANLTLDDIDADKILIRAYESHPQRQVPLNQAARQALTNYLKYRPKSKSKAVFVTKTGRPFLIRNIRTAVDRYFKEAEINNAKVNDLRHTFIAHQLEAGTPLTLVSKLVGHKRLSTTEKYLSFIKKPAAAPAKLEEL